MIPPLPSISVVLDASTCGLIGETIGRYLHEQGSLAIKFDNPQVDTDRWLDSQAAASYAGCTVNALHKATATRALRFEQDAPRGKCWTKRAWIDAWRRGEGS